MKISLRLFALYREMAGESRLELDFPEGTRLGQLLERVRHEVPGLERLPPKVLAAVNQEYAQEEQELQDGDEVALIPPVAGGSGDHVRIVEQPIEPGALLAEIATTAAGAQVLFLGTVREMSQGRAVLWLEYEAYAEMAEKTMAQVVAQAREQWKVLRVATEHRVGKLDLGEIAVGVAVSSAHRDEAFQAGRFIIDTIKQQAPIWKKEGYEDGEVWVDPGACGH